MSHTVLVSYFTGYESRSATGLLLMMLASHILSQPQEKREALISGDPPESFLNALLFRRPGTAAEQ